MTATVMAAAVLAAALIKGAIGFGFPSLATPLLSLVVDVKIAVVVPLTGSPGSRPAPASWPGWSAA